MAKDVCAILGTDTRDLPDILDHDEQRPIVDIIHTLNDSTGLRRDSRIVSEPGLYSLILRSRKSEAKAFKRWVTHEILPAIRKTGHYGTLCSAPLGFHPSSSRISSGSRIPLSTAVP